ncbi:amino acid adenylation domain-containing protein [Armatimonas sp.]|uniref:amino acid adenylation domain-containing protein n=1 Tax=Armatimonas sp. TaxID=1872638 RepID=UPI003753A21B
MTVPTCLHEFFEHAARTWPDAIAIEVPPSATRPERITLTYAQLAQAAEALRVQFQSEVIGECVVAILLSRDTALLYAAQLAVLQSGAAYVCIDPSFPDEQVREILKDSRAVLLLTDSHGLARAERGAFPVQIFNLSSPALPGTLWVRALASSLGKEGANSPFPATKERPGEGLGERFTERLAYVIYTSGTTGKPKGVLIEHRSIVSLVHSDLAEFGLGPGDRVAQGSSPAYDSSVEEIWLALASGASVVVMDDEAARLGPDLVTWLRDERITVLCPPPTLLRTTGCEHPETALPELKLLYVGGEALPRDIADRWALGRRLVNGYGPTECTVTALRGDIRVGEPITIGTPVPGLQAYVLDAELNEVAEGISGELCLGGVGLARGYHKRPELTAEKFFMHPSLGRLYRTGDLVHRDAEAKGGAFHYHGRLDSQVKLRGYRIELEAIETCLAQCDGVREAACCIQNNGNDLAAFIVPTDSTQQPDFDTLKAALREALPPYMIPALFGVLAELPKSVGGKLKRESLPTLSRSERSAERAIIAPRTPLEKTLVAAFAQTLTLDVFSVTDDFFQELGGTSLQAAQLISRLRTDPATASLTVRDLYEARTVAALAQRVLPPTHESRQTQRQATLPLDTRGERRTGLLQSLWLLLELTLASFAAYGGFFELLPTLLQRLGLVQLILLTPPLLSLGLALYTPLAVFVAVLVKRLLIGKYTPRREPVWGDFYLRHWILVQVVRLIPWPVLVGTEFQCWALRALGARIGQRVHLHRGVDLIQGGWDLLELGDDVTVSQDAALRLVELEDRHLVIGPITLGTGATLDVRAGVGPGASLASGAYLTALSSLPAGTAIPAGERWDGIPAQPAGHAPPVPPLTQTTHRALSPLAYSLALLLAQSTLWSVLALPLELLTTGAIVWLGLETQSLAHSLPIFTGLLTLALPLTLALEALAVRALGHVSEGVLARWSLGYIRVWLKAGLVDSAGEWLSGALFWPLWLRAAGMRVGRSCEISTIIDVIPGLVEIGPETFFADGIYLGGPKVHRGTVTLAKVKIGTNVFLGNHVVVAGGQSLPDDILLGVCTVANDALMTSGTSWFGHPPFALPRREIVAYDRELTHNPSVLRYLDRLFWETLRFALPVVPTLVLSKSLASMSQHMWAAPPVAMTGAATLCLTILVLKWLLLGKTRPGTHPLWSCWCSRWDFLYVAWGVYARGTLTALEGTPMLTSYLRAMGLKLGRGVVLGSGFSQVVDPDMIEIGDGATVTAAFQAHTFEDRVLKLNKVRIGAYATVGSNTVPLYGAVIGEGTYVAPHSVIMKDELLLPGQHYEGAPTR